MRLWRGSRLPDINEIFSSYFPLFLCLRLANWWIFVTSRNSVYCLLFFFLSLSGQFSSSGQTNEHLFSVCGESKTRKGLLAAGKNMKNEWHSFFLLATKERKLCHTLLSSFGEIVPAWLSPLARTKNGKERKKNTYRYQTSINYNSCTGGTKKEGFFFFRNLIFFPLSPSCLFLPWLDWSLGRAKRRRKQTKSWLKRTYTSSRFSPPPSVRSIRQTNLDPSPVPPTIHLTTDWIISHANEKKSSDEN